MGESYSVAQDFAYTFHHTNSAPAKSVGHIISPICHLDYQLINKRLSQVLGGLEEALNALKVVRYVLQKQLC